MNAELGSRSAELGETNASCDACHRNFGFRVPRSAFRVRGFSLVEVLVALAITATMLTAAMTALDTSFKSYKVTTEGASTNVVARLVIARVMAMVRIGTQFGPYPVDPLDLAQNPVNSTYIEFATLDDPVTLKKSIVRLERRTQTDPANGPYELWYVQTDYTSGLQTAQNAKPLLTGVQEARFILEYDVGQNLTRATVDLTIKPNNFQAAFVGGNLEAPSIRLVSSVNPRKLAAAP
jgi:prepilin-type N-terminal cleavage/methylation domain-containing protein